MSKKNHSVFAAERNLEPVVSLWDESWASEPFDTGPHGICNPACMAQLLTIRLRAANPEKFRRKRLTPQTLINCNQYSEYYIQNSVYLHDVGIHSMEDYGCIRFRADPILPPNSTLYKARNITYPTSSYAIMEELNRGRPVFANLYMDKKFLDWKPHMPPYKSSKLGLKRGRSFYNHSVLAFAYDVQSPTPSQQFFTIWNPAPWGGECNLGRVQCHELQCGVAFDAALGGEDESDDSEEPPTMEMDIVKVHDKISSREYTSSNYSTDEDEDEVSSKQAQGGRGRKSRRV